MKKLSLFVLFVLLVLIPQISLAQSKICVVYFTGVGCPHCAKTDPVILDELLKENPNLVIIEYEIYQQRENAYLISEYDSNYNSGLGIPLIIFNKDKHIIGDTPILENIRNEVNNLKENPCPLLNGLNEFNSINLNDLPGEPKIWTNNKILIFDGGGENNQILHELLTSNNISSVIKNINYEVIEPKPVPLSGRFLYFDNAIKLNGWIFEWNGEKINQIQTNETNENLSGNITNKSNLTLSANILFTILIGLITIIFVYFLKIRRG